MISNSLPQITFVYNRRNIASATKKAPVEIRISHNYKQKYISTGVMLYPNQWKKGKIVNCSDITQISKTLDKILSDVRQVLYEMISEGKIDLYSITERINSKHQSAISFIDFCSSRASIRMFGKRKDTKERYERFIKLFKAWGIIKSFEDITDKNIIAYDEYLQSTGMKPYSKWQNYHRFLNSFILDAIDEGYIKRNPYKWVNINKQKNSKGLERCLTPEEFHRVKTCSLPTKSLEKVRDTFIFQIYTCLSYSDLKEFDSKMVQEVKGTNVYVGIRKKTNITFTIPLLSPAINILHKYNGRLPIISNVKYNTYLKIVAQSAGIDKPISSHWARHTGATLLLNEGVPMQVVSKICGHSSTRITEQVYAKLLDETVVDAVSDLNI